MKECLVLFSGGKDSFLSSIYLIEQGYKVNLVHYDNGNNIGVDNVKIGYERLLSKYGKEKVFYLGSKNISVFIRSLIKNLYNLHIEEIHEKYGNLTMSELNCLSCRLSMYIASIIICKQKNIKCVVDGARKSQLFVIEQDEMLDRFKKLFKEYEIDLILPVKDLIDDYEEKNEILMRGFVPKVNGSQCLVGMPLGSKEVDKDSLNACIKIYDNLFFDLINSLINKYKEFELGEGLI